MTQVSLDKLSKRIKNSSASQPINSSRRKRRTTKSKVLLKLSQPFLKIKTKASPLADFMEHLLFGQRIFQKQNKRGLKTIKENTNPYLMIMDAFLFVFSLFTILNSSVNLFSQKFQQLWYCDDCTWQRGGALVFYGMYYFIYRFIIPTKTKVKATIFKSLLIISAATISWAIVLYGTTFLLPAIFKSKTTKLIYPCVRWWNVGTAFLSQKRFNIRSALTAPRQLQSYFI